VNQYASHGAFVVELEGDFDAAAVKLRRSELEALPTVAQRDIVLDFSRVGFMDSSGIGALVYLFKRLRAEDRHLVVTGAAGEPARLMQLLRIDKTITNYPTLAAFFASRSATSVVPFTAVARL
jgi:anti-anti-sigma factor